MKPFILATLATALVFPVVSVVMGVVWLTIPEDKIYTDLTTYGILAMVWFETYDYFKGRENERHSRSGSPASE